MRGEGRCDPVIFRRARLIQPHRRVLRGHNDADLRIGGNDVQRLAIDLRLRERQAGRVERVARIDEGRQQRPQLLLRGRRKVRQAEPGFRRDVGHMGEPAAADADNGDTGPRRRSAQRIEKRQRLDHAVQIADLDHPATAQERRLRLVGPCERTGVGRRRPRPGCRAPDPHRHHRLAGRAHLGHRAREGGRVADRLDHQPDDPRIGIACEMFQIAGHVGDRAIAHRDDVAHPEPAAIGDGDGAGARMRDDRDASGLQIARQAGGIERRPARQVEQAEAIGAANGHAVATGDLGHLLLQRPARFAGLGKAGSQHHGRLGAGAAGVLQRGADLVGGKPDHRGVHRLTGLAERGEGLVAVDARRAWMNRHDAAGEPHRDQVAHHEAGRGVGAFGCADHRDRARVHQRLERGASGLVHVSGLSRYQVPRRANRGISDIP